MDSSAASKNTFHKLDRLADIPPSTERLFVPDLWQQQAIRALLNGKDVIVQAPTGAGKTLVFEQWLEQTRQPKAIFTVPTRALANDKYHAWSQRGWRVGITTGDVVIDPDAPLVVATLETCKRSLMHGQGPDLLVIDEYQMLADPARGVHYETAIACAPTTTQLLLLSGSVGNPHQVAEWLRRLGREVALIECMERPVPLEEIALESLTDQVPNHISGRLPRFLARALMADLGPILVFAPRRRNAEALAELLTKQFNASDFLALTPAQKQLADSSLTRLLRHRIAYHHSGLSYAQRVGLIEPLARAGQLKIIVATTGLAAGINFSVRSVIVLDRNFRLGEESLRLRPDELLQMFGRAGRRGIDSRGSILYADGHARMNEAQSINLKRCEKMDWSNLLYLMHAAVKHGADPIAAASSMTNRLFTDELLSLGFDALENSTLKTSEQNSTPTTTQKQPSLADLANQLPGGQVIEFLNAKGIWERRAAPRPIAFGDCYYRNEDNWLPAVASPNAISQFRFGVNCRLKNGGANERRYGKQIAMAIFPQNPNTPTLRVTQWLRRALRQLQQNQNKHAPIAREWTIESLEKTILPQLPQLTNGGVFSGWIERKGTLYARLDYDRAKVMAWVDRDGQALLNPRLRRRLIPDGQKTTQVSATTPQQTSGFHHQSIATHWLTLGLIDRRGHPTRRGVITAYFQQAEGLAIAACLEADGYDATELLNDLITLRAGHRFADIDGGNCKIATFCRNCFGHSNLPGLLRNGVPEDYGEGAGIILQPGFSPEQLRKNHPQVEIRYGDIERAKLEWQSLCYQIAAAPDYPWSRWQALQQAARNTVPKRSNTFALNQLPPLTRAQRKRHPTLHWV